MRYQKDRHYLAAARYLPGPEQWSKLTRKRRTAQGSRGSLVDHVRRGAEGRAMTPICNLRRRHPTPRPAQHPVTAPRCAGTPTPDGSRWSTKSRPPLTQPLTRHLAGRRTADDRHRSHLHQARQVLVGQADRPGHRHPEGHAAVGLHGGQHAGHRPVRRRREGAATETSGTGYSAGGQALTSVTYTASGHVYTLDCADPSWTTSGSGAAAYALFYGVASASPGDSTNAVIAYWDLGGSQSLPTGSFGLTISGSRPGHHHRILT